MSRILARSENYEMDLTLDVNTQLYKLEVNNKFTLALAKSLSLDGTPDDGTFDQSGRPSLADRYEYVMAGKVYRFEAQQNKV